jgi:hypothetical protein
MTKLVKGNATKDKADAVEAKINGVGGSSSVSMSEVPVTAREDLLSRLHSIATKLANSCADGEQANQAAMLVEADCIQLLSSPAEGSGWDDNSLLTACERVEGEIKRRRGAWAKVSVMLDRGLALVQALLWLEQSRQDMRCLRMLNGQKVDDVVDRGSTKLEDDSTITIISGSSAFFPPPSLEQVHDQRSVSTTLSAVMKVDSDGQSTLEQYAAAVQQQVCFSLAYF